MSDKAYTSVQEMVDDMETCCNCEYEKEPWDSERCFPCHMGEVNNFMRKVKE